MENWRSLTQYWNILPVCLLIHQTVLSAVRVDTINVETVSLLVGLSVELETHQVNKKLDGTELVLQENKYSMSTEKKERND